jgi:hypothetical protein
MADITSNLVYHIPLDDDDTGTTVVAAVGGNGTLVGATNTSDVVETVDGRTGFNFNGVDQYVQLPDLESLMVGDDMSASFWVKQDFDPPSASAKTGILHIGNTNILTDVLLPWTDGDGYLGIFRSNPSTSRVSNINMGAAILTDWFHCAIVTTPGMFGWRFYINGVFITSTTGLSGLDQAGGEYVIGRARTAAPFGFFEGAVSDFRLYTRTLAQEDIDELFEPSLLDDTPRLQHPLNFSDFS